MRKLMIAAALTLALGGCATLQRIDAGWQAVKSSTVSPSGVVISANTFNAIEASATNFLKLKRCNGTNGPICRPSTVVIKGEVVQVTPAVVKAVRAGRAARDSLIAFQRAHPNQLGDQGVYDALQASIATLTDIFNTISGGAK